MPHSRISKAYGPKSTRTALQVFKSGKVSSKSRTRISGRAGLAGARGLSPLLPPIVPVPSASGLTMDDATRDQVLEHLASILERAENLHIGMVDLVARRRVELAVLDQHKTPRALRRELERTAHLPDQERDRPGGYPKQ